MLYHVGIMFRTIAISTFPVSLIQPLQAIRGQYGRPVYLKSDLYSPHITAWHGR